MRRLLCIAIVISLSVLLNACISRDVQVPVLLPPLRDASLQELAAIVNQYQEIRTLTTRLNIQFQSERNLEQGLSRQYKTADARLVLARPEKIRLQIQVPVVKTNIAELASNGRQFEVIVHPEDYRTFIRGTTGRRYAEPPPDVKVNHRRSEAGGFARIRPDHFTEALLIPAINLSDPSLLVVKEELRNIEPDTRPNAKRHQRIIRTYSVLSVIRQDEGRQATLVRKYWFDRTRDLHLVRQQVFGEQGDLLADVSFEELIRPSHFNGFFPMVVRIQRPHDDYSVTMRLDAPTLTMNVDVPDQAFQLEKPAEWSDTIETIDLDKLSGSKVQSNHEREDR